MTSHERANAKFKKAYKSAASILSQSTKRSENDVGERTVNIQNLTSEELKEYKVLLRKQRAAINKEERIRYREEHKKQIDGIIIFVSLVTVVSLSIFLYNNWKEKAAYAIDHSDEIISQYNISEQFQADDPRVGIVNWVDDFVDNLTGENIGKGGK